MSSDPGDEVLIGSGTTLEPTNPDSFCGSLSTSFNIEASRCGSGVMLLKSFNGTPTLSSFDCPVASICLSAESWVVSEMVPFNPSGIAVLAKEFYPSISLLQKR